MYGLAIYFSTVEIANNKAVLVSTLNFHKYLSGHLLLCFSSGNTSILWFHIAVLGQSPVLTLYTNGQY